MYETICDAPMKTRAATAGHHCSSRAKYTDKSPGDQQLGDAVGGRVEERTGLRRTHTGTRHGAVEGVADRRQGDQERRPHEVAAEDERHGTDVQTADRGR